MNPGSYGDMWKGFMNPATYSMPAMPAFTVPAMPAAPAGAAPSFNFFDPNAWTQMFQIPGLTAPAAAPAAVPAAPAAK
jgi:hypothetical protein